MPNKEIYTAESPISVKMLNGFVQDGQIEHQNEGEIWLLSKEKIQNLLTTKTDKTYFTKFIFNESVTTLKDGYTYYGSTIDNATVSSGTYYFYNCTGAVTVSGTSAKIYAVNCPNLTINGKTANNWKNIFVDGIASYKADAERWRIRSLKTGFQFFSEIVHIRGEGENQTWTYPISFSSDPVIVLTPLFGFGVFCVEERTSSSCKIVKQSGSSYALMLAIGLM